MNMRRVAAWMGLALTLLAPSAALAQRDRDYDWYRDVGPWLGRGGEEGARRAELMDRYARLRSEVRRADRQGAISPRESDRLNDRLARVARFLRNDRHLSSSEFNRRRSDLDGVARDLERAGGYRTGGRDRRY
jgi:hypothetical protein